MSAPALGRRWWAERGTGTWAAPSTPQAVDFVGAEQLHVSSATGLEGAKVCVIPWKGVLEGWRSDVAGRFVAPNEPRSQCIALDGMMVAEGRYDGSVIMLGGVWDYAATQVIVEEAGGRFCSAWGDRRLDTATGVFTTPGIADDVLAVIAEHRSDVPDPPIFRTTTLKPVPKDWTDFGLRALTSMSARRHVEHAPPLVFELVDERAAELAKPFVGITTDGTGGRVFVSGGAARRSRPQPSRTPPLPSCRASRRASAARRCSRWTPSSGGSGSTST